MVKPVSLTENERAGLEALYEARAGGTRVVARGPVSGTTVASLVNKGLATSELLGRRVRWATITPGGSRAIGRTHRDPRVVYVIPMLDEPVEGRGYRVATVTEGEDGYRYTGNWPYEGGPGQTMPYFWGPTREDAERRCNEMNQRMGVSPKEAALIITRSMGKATAK